MLIVLHNFQIWRHVSLSNGGESVSSLHPRCADPVLQSSLSPGGSSSTDDDTSAQAQPDGAAALQREMQRGGPPAAAADNPIQ